MLDDLYNGVLVAPLNWGLGHASRCIPIINYLIEKEIRVLIASDGEALDFLKQEFPTLEFLELPSYKIVYPSDDQFTKSLIKQAPQLIKTIFKEEEMIDEIVRKHRISKIISDNRYGCHHKDTQNFLITHQLSPRFKGVYRHMNWFIEQLLRNQFDKFNAVWIPDEPNALLSGELSTLGISDKQHIGVLSRFDKAHSETEYSYQLLVVLSGIEPQRSILEKQLAAQIKKLPFKCAIVRGTNSTFEPAADTSNIDYFMRLNTADLNKLMQQSKYVVCRSGYSSIMDLAALNKKAILIPTPGQLEQEYLASKCAHEKTFVVQKQDEINLIKALEEIEQTSGISAMSIHKDTFKPFIDRLID